MIRKKENVFILTFYGIINVIIKKIPEPYVVGIGFLDSRFHGSHIDLL